MHPRDLIQFRDNVAVPRMKQLFEQTPIEEGACFIDDLEIARLDGRSCGFDNHVSAAGLLFRNGVAEEYSYDECDVEFSDFFAEHKHCIFISDGKLCVADELDELDLRTRIRNIGDCGRFFPWFVAPSEINIEWASIQYEKLKYLLSVQKTAERPALDSLVNAAAEQRSTIKYSDSPERETDR